MGTAKPSNRFSDLFSTLFSSLRLHLVGTNAVRWEQGLSGLTWEVAPLQIAQHPVGTVQVCSLALNLRNLVCWDL